MKTTIEKVGKQFLLRCKYCGPLQNEDDRSLIELFQTKHEESCPGPTPN
jgi:hypothetical protein